MTDAPTTRETADHAELLERLREDAEWQRKMKGGTTNDRMLDQAADALDHLLSEIAALRGSLIKANSGFEEYERKFYLEQDAREQAERQRDEAVGLLRRWYNTRAEMSGAGTVETETRTFLANKGADQ